MKQFPLRVSQGTVAAFYRCGEQGHNFLCQFFQDSVYQKLLKPVHFGQSYHKIINKNVIAFFERWCTCQCHSHVAGENKSVEIVRVIKSWPLSSKFQFVSTHFERYSGQHRDDC